MPTIKEYQPSVGPAGPGAVINAPLSLADSAAAKGRVIEKAASQTADTIQDIGRRIDQNTVQVNMARARADFTVEVQNDVQSGAAATPDYEKKLSERVAKRLEADNKGYHTFTGVNMASAAGAQLASEFRIQAAHYQSVAVGKQAALGFSQALDANLQTVTADPMQLQSALNQTLAALQDPEGAYAGPLGAQKVAELRAEVSQRFGAAALRGVIRNVDPNLAIQMLKDGTGGAELLSAEQRRQMEGEADRGLRDREAEDERRVRFQERQDRLAREETLTVFQTRLDAKSLSIKDVNDSNLTSEQKQQYKDIVRRGKAEADPTVVNEAFRRIHLPATDPRKITTESELYGLFGRGLDSTSLNHMRAELKHDPLGADMNTARAVAEQAFMRTIVGRIEPDKAALALMNWNMEFSAAVQKKVEDKENPRDLITQGHKDNWLTAEKLQAYSMGAAQVSAEAYKAVVSSAAAADAEMKKPNFGSLPQITTVEQARALPKGTHFVLVRPGAPPELRVR